jgi:anti-sigma regulatory factor (Ser/Thr protein kinase)
MFAVPVDGSQSGIVRQTVRQLLTATELPEDVAEDVILALGEAFSNAVVHGGGTRWEQVAICAWASPRSPDTRGHVGIEMRYPGAPFDTRPPAMPMPEQLTGRGRYLMTLLMDSVTYLFPPGETIVRLEKRLGDAPVRATDTP